MQLHIKPEEVAWGGIMMALAVLLIVLAGIIEPSSVFLLAAASFITGIFQRRFSLKAGIAFTIGAFTAGFILAPQKLYCFTFAGFSIYVVVAEYLRGKGILNVAGMVVKGVCYHILLAAALILVKYFIGFDALFADGWIKKLSGIPALLAAAAVIAAEIMWIIFDRAYLYFQERYGKRFC